VAKNGDIAEISRKMLDADKGRMGNEIYRGALTIIKASRFSILPILTQCLSPCNWYRHVFEEFFRNFSFCGEIFPIILDIPVMRADSATDNQSFHHQDDLTERLVLVASSGGNFP
jgi:hypothetical protein